MQPVGSPATIAYQVESKFTVSPFNRVINFTGRYSYLTHYYLKVVDQRFHLAVNIFFWRKEYFRNIDMITVVLNCDWALNVHGVEGA